MTIKKLEPIGYYNNVHGFLYDELDKDCYCSGGCSMEAVYTAVQMEQYRREIIVDVFENYNIFDNDGNRKRLDELIEVVE